jgi:hypothetical protein
MNHGIGRRHVRGDHPGQPQRSTFGMRTMGAGGSVSSFNQVLRSPRVCSITHVADEQRQGRRTRNSAVALHRKRRHAPDIVVDYMTNANHERRGTLRAGVHGQRGEVGLSDRDPALITQNGARSARRFAPRCPAADDRSDAPARAGCPDRGSAAGRPVQLASMRMQRTTRLTNGSAMFLVRLYWLPPWLQRIHQSDDLTSTKRSSIPCVSQRHACIHVLSFAIQRVARASRWTS